MIGYLLPVVINIVLIPIAGLLAIFSGGSSEVVLEVVNKIFIDFPDFILMRVLLGTWKALNEVVPLAEILKMYIMGYIMYQLVEPLMKVFLYSLIFCIVFCCLWGLKYIVNRILDVLFQFWAEKMAKKLRRDKTVKNNFRIFRL